MPETKDTRENNKCETESEEENKKKPASDHNMQEKQKNRTGHTNDADKANEADHTNDADKTNDADNTDDTGSTGNTGNTGNTEVLSGNEAPKCSGFLMLVHTRERIRGILLAFCLLAGLICASGSAASVAADSIVYPALSMDFKTSPYQVRDGIAYFNQNPVISIRAREQIHGLASLEVRNQGNLLYSNQNISGEQLTGELEGELYVPDGMDGRISLTARAVSISGYESEAALQGVVDHTAPVLELRYDRTVPGNGECYRESLEAQLLIAEEHFDLNGVQLQIRSEHGGRAAISEWTSGGQNLYVLRISFCEEDTYRFTVSVTDLAGNSTALTREDWFTIDRTPPEVEFSYLSAADGSGAADICRGPVDCIVRVTEQNFDPERLQIQIFDQTKEWSPKDWEWDGSGYRQSFRLETEGTYQILAEGSDRAGNAVRKLLAESLQVDSLPPELIWSGVLEGEICHEQREIALLIREQNLLAESLKIVCESQQGGVFEPEASISILEDGQTMCCRLAGFGQVEGIADWFTIRAVAEDLAGNRSMSQLRFGINRAGVRYTGGNGWTKALLEAKEKLIFQEAEELVLLEESMEEVAERSLLLLRDGETILNEKGMTVQERVREDGWHVSSIRIPAELLKEEGHYVLSLLTTAGDGRISALPGRGTGLKFEIRRDVEALAESSDEKGSPSREKTAASVAVSGVSSEGELVGSDSARDAAGPDRETAQRQEFPWILLGFLLLIPGFILMGRLLVPAGRGSS